MKEFLKKKTGLAANVDRIESRYGNVMVRGWALDRKTDEQTVLKVQDADGKEIPAYVERLVRSDVNETFQKPEDYASGFHILLDRAVLDTAAVWIVVRAEKNMDSGIAGMDVDGNLKRNPGETVLQEVSERDIREGVPENRRKNAQEELRLRIQVRASNWLERRIRLHKEKKEDLEPDYDLWIRNQMVHEKEARAQRKAAEHFAKKPLFSVVIPLYNTPKPFLKEIVDSVLQQTYANVELCLADGSSDPSVREFLKKHYAQDKRLRYRKLKENRGISENTNEALRMAKGDFIVFADHDDVLERSAFYEMAAAVNQEPEIDVIYTDEDKVNRSGTAYFGPHFKPDYNRELLCCNNYICHLFAVRRDLLKKVGLLNREYDGAQDYDFVLRCCEKAKRIHHIPKVLYHWRTHPMSTAGNPASKAYAFEAGRRALEAHYERVGIRAQVENTEMLGRYRTRFAIQGQPLVSILIPNKDHIKDLTACLSSIVEKTTYPLYEIVIIENNSEEQSTEEFYQALEEGKVSEYAELVKAGRLRVVRYPGSFNYSAIHNFAVPYTKGEYLLLLNNDTEVCSGGWIEEMIGLCQQKDIGAVGAKLYYPDGTIQHAGVVIGLCGVASHLFIGAAGDADGYAGRLKSVQDVSAVTAACMMTKRAVYEAVGGLTEELAVAYNDIDYCMKVRKIGYLVAFTPYAELTHFESKSRGLEDSKEKQERLGREAGIFCRCWKKELEQGDPYYSPSLSLTKTDCSLRKTWELAEKTRGQETHESKI